MAAGKINLQKASGGITAITGVDGTGNTQLVLPESGTVATLDSPTFTGSVIVPTPTTDTQAANKAYVNSVAVGLGQTVQTFTVGTQRVSGATYTNSTGKPIEIYISGSSGGGGWNITLTINGTQALIMGVTSNQGEGMCFSGIIPNGATYVVGNSGASISSWKELR